MKDYFEQSYSIIKECLPLKITHILDKTPYGTLKRITEIRLRRDSASSVVIDGKSYFISNFGLTTDGSLALITDSNDISDFLFKFCNGSVFAHENTLCDFYVVNKGIRVGLCAGSLSGDGKNIAIESISSLVIRIARHIDGFSGELYDNIKNDLDGELGVLVISKPGIGKTTLLRDLALKLGCGKMDETSFIPRRVLVIDERKEIYMKSVFEKTAVDFLSGIPKIQSLEIAYRLLSPEIIICDEISGPDEAQKIGRIKSRGVNFIASVHSSSFEAAMSKDYIKDMFEQGIFTCAYVLSRQNDKVKGSFFKYEP